MKVRRRRFAALDVALDPRFKPRPGRCNFLKPNTQFCGNKAGFLTGHAGTGYCFRHDKSTFDPVHRYRGMKEGTIVKHFAKLNKLDRDVFDLVPEITLLRAMLIDFVDRFYTFRKALLAWSKEEGVRPKGMVDIAEAARLVEAVTKVVERQHRMEREGSISLETFRRATEQMGIIVAKHVRDVKLLDQIENDWRQVSLDTKSAVPSLAEPKVEHPSEKLIAHEED